MLEKAIDEWIAKLAKYKGENVYNPWSDYDSGYDLAPEAYKVRQEHLKQYLMPRLGKCRHIICAEAIGYQGGRFTGIAITCERMLLGNHKIVNVEDIFLPEYIPNDLKELRTSNPNSPNITKRTQKELGFNEPTDTVVWGAIKEHNIDPFSCLLWNIFPFHPHKKDNPLSNRTPSLEELEIGWSFAKDLIKLNGECKILAVGQKAATTLTNFGCEVETLRHPANGGATKYKEQFAAIMKKSNKL